MDLEQDQELTSSKNWPHFGTHMVIKMLDGSSYKNSSSQQKMELNKNSE